MKTSYRNSKGLFRGIFCLWIVLLVLSTLLGCQGSGDSNDANSSVLGQADEYEEDDTFSEATFIENGTSQVHNFFDDATDWLKFVATVDTEYIIETQDLSEGADTFLYIYDLNATNVLTYNDDGGVLKASKITWLADSNGTYYIKVDSYEGASGENLNYTISLTQVAQEEGYVDLTVSELSVPTTLESITEPINGRIAILNQGSSDIDTSFEVGIYLSDDQNITQEDMMIGYYEVASLKAGQALYSYDVNITIPTSSLDMLTTIVDELSSISILSEIDDNVSSFIDVVEGESYYVGAIVDIGENIAELDELNNISSSVEIVVEAPVEVPQIFIDEYEEDDTQDTATQIEIGELQEHNFYDDASDWLTFYAYTHSQYTIQTSALGSFADTKLSLSGMSGENNTTDDNGGDEALASKIVFRPAYSGNYYVEVSSVATIDLSLVASATGSNREYTVLVSSVAVGIADDYEDDDSIDVAQTIAVGDTQSHNFYDDTNDWLLFDAIGGVAYVVQTKSLGSFANTFLEIYDTDATTLLVDDNNSGTEANASKITWSAPQNGTYYIKVSSADGSKGEERNYDIFLKEATLPDLYEEDDTFADATLISVGDIQNHNFSDDAADWLKFDAVVGTTYQIETSDLGALSDTLLTLYSTDGTTSLVSDDNSGTDSANASLILWTPLVSGTYYIKVSSSGSAVGDDQEYTISLTQPSL